MFDEIFDRSYQAGRSELNAGLDTLFRRIGRATGTTFRVLHQIEFDAPWKRASRDVGHA